MVNPYTFRRACLRRLLLLLLPGFAYTAHAQERKAAALAAVEPQCYCPCRPDGPLTGSIAGPSDLNKTDLFYLSKTDKLTGPVTWAASPAALFTSAGATNSTTFLTAPSGCSTGTAVITATVRVESCRDSIVLRKEITVSGSGALPVVRGTYYCTTCSDRSVKTLQLDGNTNNVTSFGTYRIDLTSSNSQDVFNAWDKFETAGASLRMVSGTNNHSGLIDLTPNSNLAALAANVTNGCRAVRQMFRFSGGNATGYNLVSSPNPASNELRVGQPEAAAAAAKGAQAASTGVLYDGYGREVLRGQGPAGQVRLDVRALPAGVYILRTTTEGLVRSERIQVVH